MDAMDVAQRYFGVRQHNRGLDLTELMHLRAAHELAVAVAHHNSRRDTIVIQVAWMGPDGGCPGADRVAFDHRHVADQHPSDIGNRIQGTGRKNAGCDAQGARARAWLWHHHP
jgi:hypothetical protein